MLQPKMIGKKIAQALFGSALGLSVLGAAHAETAADFIKLYASEAGKQTPGFTASAERGRAFFLQKNTASADFPNCASCHTDNPANEGKHVVTGKRIAPMAPAVNTERFTDKDKVEKWFKRNCNDVIGRACSSAEKADFVAYLAGVKK